MSNPKKQHIVPRVYLNGFTNQEGLLNFYDRENKKYKKQNPNTVTIIPNFYTLYNSDEKPNYEVEKFFGENIENNISTVIDKIKSLNELNNNDKTILANFITFQFLRTQVFKNSIEKGILYDMEWRHKIICDNEELLNQHIKKYENKTGKKFPLEREQYISMYQDYEIKVPKKHFIEAMFWMYDKIYPIFRYSDWVFIVLKNKETSFLTSDNPFSIHNTNNSNPFGGGLLSKDLIKLFPITKNICLRLDSLDNYIDNQIYYHKMGNKNLIRFYNSIIALNSYRLIIGRDEKLVKKIIEINNIAGKKKFDPTIISGPIGNR